MNESSYISQAEVSTSVFLDPHGLCIAYLKVPVSQRVSSSDFKLQRQQSIWPVLKPVAQASNMAEEGMTMLWTVSAACPF
jgi:hypothetical protein